MFVTFRNLSPPVTSRSAITTASAAARSHLEALQMKSNADLPSYDAPSQVAKRGTLVLSLASQCELAAEDACSHVEHTILASFTQAQVAWRAAVSKSDLPACISPICPPHNFVLFCPIYPYLTPYPPPGPHQNNKIKNFKKKYSMTKDTQLFEAHLYIH